MTPSEYQHIRKQVGTQAAVAAMLGVSRETVAFRETGRTDYPIRKEAELALLYLLEQKKAGKKAR